MIKLSDEQVKIIESNEKHLAIIAGAGTGKTTVLTKKIVNLIERGIDPKTILAITFTKKAAIEMQKRIKNHLVKVMTFDSYCYNLIKHDKQINIIEDNIPFYRKDVLSFHLYDANLKKDKLPKGYLEYVFYKNKYNYLDFNDIEYLALSYLKDENYNYILVDEFQDTNMLQLLILKKLIKPTTKTIVVGDPDQSIYGFRGAKSDVFNEYINFYHAKILTLTNNYRSYKKIIAGANSIISYNEKRIKKNLVPHLKFQGQIIVRSYSTEEDEAKYVYSKILKEEEKTKSIAVLYRNHSMAYELKLLLKNHNKQINLLTVHEAKGLEFDVVFIIGLNNNVFPSRLTNKKATIEEDRRLMFVAVTRAKYKLYLTFNKQQSLFINEMVNSKKT